MNIKLSAKQAKAMQITDAEIHTLVSACFYIGMGQNQILDLLRRGRDSRSWKATLEVAIGLGFDPAIDLVELEGATYATTGTCPQDETGVRKSCGS